MVTVQEIVKQVFIFIFFWGGRVLTPPVPLAPTLCGGGEFKKALLISIAWKINCCKPQSLKLFFNNSFSIIHVPRKKKFASFNNINKCNTYYIWEEVDPFNTVGGGVGSTTGRTAGLGWISVMQVTLTPQKVRNFTSVYFLQTTKNLYTKRAKLCKFYHCLLSEI